MGLSKRVVGLGVLVALLLVAAAIASAIVFTNHHGQKNHDTSKQSGSGGGSGSGNETVVASKAVKMVCSTTDFKETCEKSIADAKTSDPKELVGAAFGAAVGSISGVLKSTAELKKAATDPSMKGAFEVCDEVLQNAVDDLKTSSQKLTSFFNPAKAKAFVAELRTRLAAVGDDQETCIDAFENTTGDAGDKMKAMLKTGKEMSSNGLAMVTDLFSIIGSPQLSSFLGGAGARRLMAEEEDVASAERRILQAAALKPTMVVAQDGSGQYKTISAALEALPKKNTNATIVIYIKAGVYKETCIVPKKVNKVVFIGDGPGKTVITGNLNFAAGVKTYHTATVVINADEFLAKDITFENTAGYKGHQAVALRVSGDMAVFHNVHILGYQDTLYAHKYRQFYSGCTISGTVDFVFGDALAIFQKCTFVVRKPGPNQACMVTAEGRIDPRSPGGFVLQNSSIVAEEALLSAEKAVKVYLGRPWKELSRTIIMASDIGGFVDPTGWAPWSGTFAIDTCYYGEYKNRGAGSNTSGRVQWKGIKKITPEIAQSWTGGAAYGDDSWIEKAGVPYVSTL
ncbi:pectinesterase-like [Salvia hispanica]|uniref:pectinesterase-like n=1 Tax=Salvia hispanica TaxID=49212 RepID=UPI002009CE69|nr:pectinesterase-like [Salvia hispanica]